MKIRILLFDDDEQLRPLIAKSLRNLGYEVYDYPYANSCPLYLHKDCPCDVEYMCSDILITDMNMPMGTGLEFIKNQRLKKCKIKNFIIISGSMSFQDDKDVEKEGLKVFHKPFPLETLYYWIEECIRGIDPKRKLSNWFQNGEK